MRCMLCAYPGARTMAVFYLLHCATCCGSRAEATAKLFGGRRYCRKRKPHAHTLVPLHADSRGRTWDRVPHFHSLVMKDSKGCLVAPAPSGSGEVPRSEKETCDIAGFQIPVERVFVDASK